MITFRRLDDIDKEIMKTDFSSCSFVTNPKDDAEELALQFYNDLSEIMNRHAPLIQKEIIDRSSTPWYTDKCKELKLEKRKAERRYMRNKLAINLDMLKQIIIKYKEICHIEKSNYYLTKIKNCNKDQTPVTLLGI